MRHIIILLLNFILAFLMLLSPFIFMILGAISPIFLLYLLYRGLYAESPTLGDNIFCHLAFILGFIGMWLGLWLWNWLGEKFKLL